MVMFVFSVGVACGILAAACYYYTCSKIIAQRLMFSLREVSNVR